MVGYKINMPKLVAFLHINKIYSERNHEKKIPTIRINTLGLNQTKEVKGMNDENSQTLRKLKKTSGYGETSHACGLAGLIYKMIILPKAMCGFNEILIKNSIATLHRK